MCWQICTSGNTDSLQQHSPYASLSIHVISATFPPCHLKKQNNRTRFEWGVHNSIVPHYLTRTSWAHLPRNLVSVFQNSNSNSPTFFFPLLGNILALRIKCTSLFEWLSTRPKIPIISKNALNNSCSDVNIEKNFTYW